MPRNTNQREAIRGVFARAQRPMSAEEVLEAGRSGVESLNLATVYRNLRLLVADGRLRKLQHPELGPLYESAEKAHHHHFHCRSCARLYELPGCALDVSGSTPDGFRTDDHEVFLYGLCVSCARPSR
ncbi:MAG: transcriptional repressor [Armatimonadetes bacterium]|nr:transcriptional repressor [Armatimonadota bacterium]